jgi:2-phosphosulfolactate phosphatase
MPSTLEVLFTPAEFIALQQRDLTQTVCVVFDVLRTSTTMIVALANGAEAILPVSDIPEALAMKQLDPELMLAGERDGLRITAPQTGSIDFDLGNSPREFTPDKVRGKTIVMTTTNGTRALRACLKAKAVLISSFLNLRATAQALQHESAPHLVIVCAGTGDQAAYEDALAAGALCDLLWPAYARAQVSDSAWMARELYRPAQHNLLDAFSQSRNGRRLLAIPELANDLTVSVRRDVLTSLAALCADGAVRTRKRPDWTL